MQSPKVYCSVKDCRYSCYHVTAGHKCGKCNQFGHGRIECSFPKQLPKVYWCTIKNCKTPGTHMKLSHHCFKCGELHEEDNCKDNDKFDIFKKPALKIFKETDGKVYCILTAGMGCMMYVRRDDVKSKLKYFFMHSDAWGQYGPSSDDRPKLNEFIKGYTEMEQISPVAFDGE